jgi:hypothetical protein
VYKEYVGTPSSEEIIMALIMTVAVIKAYIPLTPAIMMGIRFCHARSGLDIPVINSRSNLCSTIGSSHGYSIKVEEEGQH